MATRAERDALFYAAVADARADGLQRITALRQRYGDAPLFDGVALTPKQEERQAYNRAVLDTWRGEPDFVWTYTDEIDQIVTETIGEDPREQSVRLLATCLAQYSPDSRDEWVRQTAAAIEQSCYNASIELCRRTFIKARWGDGPFLQYYSNRVAAVAENLDPSSAVGLPYLGEELAAGRIQASAVGYMSPYELCPPATSELRADLERRSQMRVLPRASKLYPCPRCKKRECTYQERQLASADEASTLVLECLVCHHQWLQ